MKKLFTIALAFVLTASLAACGCQAQEEVPATTIATTAPTTAATTAPTTAVTMPAMDPTTATNIPDPEVDNNSTEMTEEIGESTGENETTSGTPAENTDAAGSRSRMGR